jgi:hypothetical protein
MAVKLVAGLQYPLGNAMPKQLLTALDLDLLSWRSKVGKALRLFENRRRIAAHQKPFFPFNSVEIAELKSSQLQLYNWKVWTFRHCISLEFILEVLLTYWRNQRHIKPTDQEIKFGLPVSLLTGDRSRMIIEEAVQRAFPTGENWKVMLQPSRPLPLGALEYAEDDDDAMLDAYTQAMLERQQKAFDVPVYERNFRRPGDKL